MATNTIQLNELCVRAHGRQTFCQVSLFMDWKKDIGFDADDKRAL